MFCDILDIVKETALVFLNIGNSCPKLKSDDQVGVLRLNLALYHERPGYDAAAVPDSVSTVKGKVTCGSRAAELR